MNSATEFKLLGGLMESKDPLEQCPDCRLVFPKADFFNRLMCRECQIKRANHPQVLVTLDDGEQFHVDEKMAELVCLLNNRGYWTINSCQANKQEDNQDIAWLQFHWRAVIQFKKLFGGIRQVNKSLFKKLVCRNNWSMLMSGNDNNDDIQISVSLRFLAADIAEFVSTLKQM